MWVSMLLPPAGAVQVVDQALHALSALLGLLGYLPDHRDAVRATGLRSAAESGLRSVSRPPGMAIRSPRNAIRGFRNIIRISGTPSTARGIVRGGRNAIRVSPE